MFKKTCRDAWNVVKRGNMFMLAIGLLLGASFNAVVSSLTNDILAKAIANAINIKEAEGLVINGLAVGKFLSALFSFIIVSAIVFFSLIIVFGIRNSLIAKKYKKYPPVNVIQAPSTEQLMLAELKKMNEHLTSIDTNNTK
ncbi:MscL family protein [Mycoplasmopsis adleri]|uniref:large conductance mechanosensitive channel protein MscL n=1 Tax=Mycoplasmopsis adleri TaxID=51362 RepID=UPI003873C341